MPLVTVHLQPAVIPSRVAPPTFPGVVGPRWLKNLMLSVAGRLVIDRMISTPCLDRKRFRVRAAGPPRDSPGRVAWRRLRTQSSSLDKSRDLRDIDPKTTGIVSNRPIKIALSIL